MSDAGPAGTDALTEQLVVARSSRLRIRHKVHADAIDDFTWARDPEIARFNGTTPRDQTLAAFLAEFDYDLAFGPPTRRQFAIESVDGVHIGTVMFYNASYADASAELGMTTVLVGDHAATSTAPFVHHRTLALAPFLASAKLKEIAR